MSMMKKQIVKIKSWIISLPCHHLVIMFFFVMNNNYFFSILMIILFDVEILILDFIFWNMTVFFTLFYPFIELNYRWEKRRENIQIFLTPTYIIVCVCHNQSFYSEKKLFHHFIIILLCTLLSFPLLVINFFSLVDHFFTCHISFLKTIKKKWPCWL